MRSCFDKRSRPAASIGAPVKESLFAYRSINGLNICGVGFNANVSPTILFSASVNCLPSAPSSTTCSRIRSVNVPNAPISKGFGTRSATSIPGNLNHQKLSRSHSSRFWYSSSSLNVKYNAIDASMTAPVTNPNASAFCLSVPSISLPVATL